MSFFIEFSNFFFYFLRTASVFLDISRSFSQDSFFLRIRSGDFFGVPSFLRVVPGFSTGLPPSHSAVFRWISSEDHPKIFSKFEPLHRTIAYPFHHHSHLMEREMESFHILSLLCAASISIGINSSSVASIALARECIM